MFDKWQEYDSAAFYMAKRGRHGKPGEALPMGLSKECLDEIKKNPEAFEERVRASAYAISMEQLSKG